MKFWAIYLGVIAALIFIGMVAPAFMSSRDDFAVGAVIAVFVVFFGYVIQNILSIRAKINKK